LGLFARLPFGDRRRFSARVYFAVLSAGLLVPALLISWRLANDSAASEQAGIEQNILQKADELSGLVDREVSSNQNILVALAGSKSMQRGDLEGFYRRAAGVAQKLDLEIVVSDGQKLLMNTGLPWGTNLAKAVAPPFGADNEEALRSGRPFVSNIFWGPLVRHYVAAVSLPVTIGGSVTPLLSIGIPV
jgi:hypothetical protein